MVTLMGDTSSVSFSWQDQPDRRKPLLDQNLASHVAKRQHQNASGAYESTLLVLDRWLRVSNQVKF